MFGFTVCRALFARKIVCILRKPSRKRGKRRRGALPDLFSFGCPLINAQLGILTNRVKLSLSTLGAVLIADCLLERAQVMDIIGVINRMCGIGDVLIHRLNRVKLSIRTTSLLAELLPFAHRSKLLGFTRNTGGQLVGHGFDSHTTKQPVDPAAFLYRL